MILIHVIFSIPSIRNGCKSINKIDNDDDYNDVVGVCVCVIVESFVSWWVI